MSLEVWQYAALSEIVYRRSSTDQALDVNDVLAGTGFAEFTNIDFARLDQASSSSANSVSGSGGFVVNLDNGFTALVVQNGDEYVIVFRGSDAAAGVSFGDRANAFANGESTPEIDGGDWPSNNHLSAGAYFGLERVSYVQHK